MVNFLSNSSLRLALYPTDWSSEHFCVDKYVSVPLCVYNIILLIVINLLFRVTANVKLVDLENVVIVNLTSTQHLPIHKYDPPPTRTIEIFCVNVQIFFRSDNYGCNQGECFSYSIPELCGHSASDHNYFAVCSNILSPAPHSLNLLSSPVQRVRGNFGVFRN